MTELEVIKARTKGDVENDGLKVAIVPVSVEEGSPVLIQISGIDNQYAGLVLKHEKKENASWMGYKTQIHGRDFYPFNQQTDNWGRTETYIQFYGQVGKKFFLSYDEGYSEKIDPVKLLNLHNDQQNKIQELTTFNMDYERNQIHKKLDEDKEYFKSQSGHELNYWVNWETIDQKAIVDVNIPSQFGEVYRAFRRIWDVKNLDPAPFKKFTDIEFHRSDKTKIWFEGSKVIAHFDFEQYNMSDFIFYNLLNYVNQQ